ncbi:MULTISPECIES: PAS domain-containing sensor histidine kinase [unclassified Cellulophaga]|uniref:PAS domain-containing sensor histidine kinase n=1 Tax=unclassified Cellulophaga TaxID=2634405 RepID=UPI0026E334BE|nr:MULTISPECIES: PAS domain S-box protein [unclassified Cellulophaga]MDO6491133.1 PAS domain S-box protein [Cellulophaga sp. 2_MG-2023]MDO6495334.1 PAS domain S-box protein [Cellulophaga sp. 3_MG-2023]
MQKTQINLFIDDAPIEMGVLDVNMHFVKCSKLWLNKIAKSEKEIIGKSYYEVFPDTTEEIKKIHEYCLKGSYISFEGEKILSSTGKVQWFNYKINSWKNEKGKVGGLIIVREDISNRRNEEEYRLKAQEIANIGGWEVNLVNNEVYWTSITKEIHGLDDSYVPTLESGINFYKEGYHREKIVLLISDAIGKGIPWDVELIIVTSTGIEKWVRAIGKVEYINGKAVKLTGTFQDVDTKKRAELAHFETQKRLNIATKTANIGVWDYDLFKQELSCDNATLLLYESKKENTNNLYKSWKNRLLEEDRERVVNEMYYAIQNKDEFNTEFRIKLKSGKIKYIKSIAQLHKDPNTGAIKMIGANWDITEYKNTVLKLDKRKESFAGVFNNSSVGMALIGLDGKWLKINKSLCSSLGYKQEELLELTFQDVTHPDDYLTDLNLLDELIAGKIDNYQIEKRYFHKKGHTVYVILSVTKVTKIDGSISHFISQVVDITSRIEAENKVKAVLKITADQNESLTNFAHIVSHNLRSHSTNLSMLTGFLINETDPEERANLINMLNESSDSLDETITHLNEVVSVKLNVLGKLEGVRLLETFDSVRKSIIALLNENDVILNIRIPKEYLVNAVPAYLESILLNLLTNSIKYSSPKRRLVVDIKAKRERDKIKLTFSDNGLGIDMKRHKDKIFGMYKTFHKHKKSKGIGLFITKSQIEAMNGKIEVESSVDIGTTFTLYFNCFK